MLKNLIIKISSVLITLLFVMPLVHAQAPLNPTGEKIFLPASDTEAGKDQGQFIFSTFFPTFTKNVINITGALSLLFVIVSGIQILSSFGEEDKITGAKKTLTWALVGLIISTLSYAIVQIITSVKL